MNDNVPRMRMFAGPNGSGKTTVKNSLRRPPCWFGLYINPDEIETAVKATGRMPFADYQLNADTKEVQEYFRSSLLLQQRGLSAEAGAIVCRDGGIDFSGISFNSYHASVIADFLRRKAIERRLSFTFETVMSSEDKVQLMCEAQRLGYRTYLYFISTDNPEINVQRVQNRVVRGGHDVPREKVVARYERSLKLLPKAIECSSRAFAFDTSTESTIFLAEITDGADLELKAAKIPGWFVPIWEHFRERSGSETS